MGDNEIPEKHEPVTMPQDRPIVGRSIVPYYPNKPMKEPLHTCECGKDAWECWDRADPPFAICMYCGRKIHLRIINKKEYEEMKADA